MYTVTKNIKIFSFTLMAIGFIGLAYGFYTAPQSIEESKAIVASYADDGHGSDHSSNSEHATDSHNQIMLRLQIKKKKCMSLKSMKFLMKNMFTIN